MESIINTITTKLEQDFRKEYKTPIEIALGVDENGMTTARALYEFLGLAPSQFARWAKQNIENNEFYEENSDWVGFDIVSNGNKCRDYRLTTDFAKHLSMESHSERGKEARQYFITIENKAKEFAINRSELSPQMQMFYAIADEQAKMELKQKQQEKEMASMKNKIKDLEAKVTTHNEDYYTIAGYASLRGLSVDINKANMLGRKASRLSKEYGYDISRAKDVRFGTVNAYHTDILKEVFKK